MEKILITISLIWIGLMSLSRVGNAYGPENIMAVWLLDEKGGNKAKDSSDHDNDGELIKGPKRIDGVFGRALQFDGTNNVVIQDHPTLDAKLNAGFTFVCWQNQPPGDADGGFLVKEEGWMKKMSYRFFSNHGNDFGFMVVPQDGTVEEYSAGAPKDNTWHHVAAVYDGSKIISYQDGKKLIAWPYNKGVADTDARVFIGSGHPDGEYFTGALDELALFNVVLSVDEIGAIMRDGLGASLAAVSPASKLTTTWSQIKQQ